MTMQIESHNWASTIRAGADLAAQQVRSDVDVKETHVIWALLCEAAQTSSRAYSGPPRTGFPRKSIMPDAPDDVSHWHMMMAYIKGQVENAPEDRPTPPTPSAEQISRAEVILHIWHHYALRKKGARHRMKKAVYLKACGVADRKVRIRHRLHPASHPQCKRRGHARYVGGHTQVLIDYPTKSATFLGIIARGASGTRIAPFLWRQKKARLTRWEQPTGIRSKTATFSML
jgi:hypothetical protein